MIATTPEAVAWAKRLAASLPPFTDSEAAAMGRLLAGIDKRRAAEKSGSAA